MHAAYDSGEHAMKTKWIVWWRDGTVTVWDAAAWTAAQIAAMANVIDAALCPAETAAEVAEWWASDRWHGNMAAAHLMAEAVEAS